ncbi:anthrax toxin-like adenylyl cyclase domain-containing protein [Candidatus Phycorickettsia trachydisci]|nr:anthrax toxin-like adenylyl cyclase domain-containing protein [Candidatus Phycorickettsia trachydisci]
MNQQAPPKNPQSKKPSLKLSLSESSDITQSIDKLTGQEEQDLMPSITIRNKVGLNPLTSLASTIDNIDSLESPRAYSPTPKAYLPTPNRSDQATTKGKANRFFSEESEAYFKEIEKIRSEMDNSTFALSKTLSNTISDLDPEGILHKTIRAKTRIPNISDTLQDQSFNPKTTTSELSGFKILTQEQIVKEYNSRSEGEKEFNISDTSIKKLQDIAKSNEIVIITRPVNSTALTLMKEEEVDAVGKNMFVHGKSADNGSLAEGLIPVNSGSSKAGKDDDADKIKAYNAENRKSLEESLELFELIQAKLQIVAPERRARLGTELDNLNKKTSLTKEEIKHKSEIEIELREGPTPDKLLQEAKIPAEYFDQIIFASPVLDKNGNQIYVFEDESGIVKKDNKKQIHAIQEKDGKLYFIDKNHNHNSIPQEIPAGYNKIPLQVIGKPEIIICKDGSLNIGKVRPITADIDVLAYGAKLNLQEFDKMHSYHEVVSKEKEQLLKDSPFQLTPEARNALINDKIDDVLKKPGVIPSSLKQDQEFMKLADTFKSIEVQRENLKGMGHAPDAIIAITGAMRAEFKDSVEISHASEQFNTVFTQPLDDKWVLIDPNGSVKSIKGEKELLETFNHFKDQGLSMPPNPNWGWELKEGKYEKNKDLVDISASCQQLCLKMYSLKEEHEKAVGTQKDKINQDIKFVSNILKLQTEIGLTALTEPKDDKEFAESIKNLKRQIERNSILTIEDRNQIKNNKKSRENIYEPQIQQVAQKQERSEKEHSHNTLTSLNDPSVVPNHIQETDKSLSSQRKIPLPAGENKIPDKVNSYRVQKFNQTQGSNISRDTQSTDEPKIPLNATLRTGNTATIPPLRNQGNSVSQGNQSIDKPEVPLNVTFRTGNNQPLPSLDRKSDISDLQAKNSQSLNPDQDDINRAASTIQKFLISSGNKLSAPRNIPRIQTQNKNKNRER